MIDVTDRQLEIFRFIERHIEERGYAPTRQDISDEFGFKSANAAEQHLKALAAKGAIKLVPSISRGIVLLASSPKPKPPPRRAAR